MLHFLFWTVLIGAGVLAYWAMNGNGSMTLFTDSPLYIDFILFALGLNLAIVRGINIFKAFGT